MRKYFEYINDINSTEIFDGLVGFGMFAEKIPDFLTSVDFSNYTKNLALPLNTVKDKDYIRYSSMRNINIPRQMAIPDPFAYSNLCNCFAENWNRIQKYFKFETRDQKYKISRIHLRKMDENNSLFEMNYKNFDKDGSPEDEILIRSKYIVKADISNFFPSIYSHSIPWALKGKKYSKNNRKQEYWFNQLDYYTRCLKYGETNGVLIGPHVSNLISEIVLVKIDRALLKKGYNFVRYIDDYSCYVPSYECAEDFLVDITEELRKYELKLNDNKSKIIPLPQAQVTNWVNKLNDYIFVNTYKKDGIESIKLKDLKSFFDYVILLFLEEGKDSAILNYAIKMIAEKYIGFSAKTYFIHQIHHLVLLYPYLIHLLDEFVFEKHSIPKIKIKVISRDIYDYGLKKRFFEANSYAIFWSLKYDFELEDIMGNLSLEAENSEDAVFLLLAYLYEKKRGRDITKYKDIARKLKYDFDRYWLYIYEVLPWRELAKEYRAMKKNNNISFIKQEYR